MIYMKRVMTFLLLLCFPAMVSADNDEYYYIFRQENLKGADFAENGEKAEEQTRSKTIIKDDIDIMKNDIKTSKMLMYREISRFKHNF